MTYYMIIHTYIIHILFSTLASQRLVRIFFPHCGKFPHIFPTFGPKSRPDSGARSGTVENSQLRTSPAKGPPIAHISHTCTGFSTFLSRGRPLGDQPSRVAGTSQTGTGILQP